jgi:hypothetical protein
MTRGSDKIKEADMIDPNDLAELATTLHRRAYAGTVAALRGELLAAMGEQIANDRAKGAVPGV